tara:strand:- start:390 stop:1016 length:627 start_codon:yes stop_codon:yes gene_type:complete
MENQFKSIRNNQIDSNLIQQSSMQTNKDNFPGFDNSMSKFDNTNMTETSINMPKYNMTRDKKDITGMQIPNLDNVTGFDNSMSQFDDTNMTEARNSVPRFYINDEKKLDNENSLVENTDNIPKFEIQDNLETNNDTVEPFMNMLGGMNIIDTSTYFSYDDLNKDNRFVNDSMLNDFNKRLVKKTENKIIYNNEKKINGYKNNKYYMLD